MNSIFQGLLIALLANLSLGCNHVCSSPSDGPVLGGVDLVKLRESYSVDPIPVVGSKEFNVTFGGFHFLFTSANNAAKFSSNPEMFIPQLGGYCSWGLTGFDIHVDDPSGYCLAGACINSTNGYGFFQPESGDLENYWYLKFEAKYDMEKTGTSQADNIAAAKKNFDTILKENNAKYCFNTAMIRTCK